MQDSHNTEPLWPDKFPQFWTNSPTTTMTTIATAKQPKSILKKTPSTSSTPATTSTTNTPTDRNREIALYHANLLQARKDTELTILLNIETLIDYPLSQPPTYTSSSPSPPDATSFKSLLTPFQPSDFDTLIEERNINERCGYALCPNPRLKEGGGGTWRLLGMGGKAKDFRVVKKEELEKWCSEECARRAMWVRVQLSESPAWERGAKEYGVVIELLDEPKEKTEEDGVMEGIERLNLSGEGNGKEERDRRDLALERGYRGAGAEKGLVDVRVLEKDIKGEVQPPSLGEEELSGKMEHLVLEGYTSKFGEQRERFLRKERDGDEMDEDDEDTDWKL